MNSVFHARSAAKKFGGVWQDYHPLHHFLDSSKASFASIPHRLFLHTDDLGRHLLKMKFGESFVNADGVAIATDTIMDQHLDEDFYFRPTLQNWLDHAAPTETQVSLDGYVRFKTSERSSMRRRVPSDVVPWLADPVATAVARHGGTRADYEPLFSFFGLPSRFSHHPQADLVLENSFGIFLAEEVFGPVLSLSSGREVPLRIVAEKFVCARRGYIPTPAQLAGTVTMQTWMVGTPDPDEHPETEATSAACADSQAPDIAGQTT